MALDLIVPGELRAHEGRARRVGAAWVDQQGATHTEPTEPLWTWDRLQEPERTYLLLRAKHIAACEHPRTVDLVQPPNPVRDIEFPEEAGVWGPPQQPGTFTLPEPLAFGFLCALYHVACPHPLWWRRWFRRPNSRERGGPDDIINAVYHCPCCQHDVPHHKQRGPLVVLGGGQFRVPHLRSHARGPLPGPAAVLVSTLPAAFRSGRHRLSRRAVSSPSLLH
jgi:hypothetical protein